MKSGTRKLIWVGTGILLFVTLIVMFMTHRAIDFTMDDEWYSSVLYDKTIPISSFQDIIEAQIWHYFNWGGRSITHGILQLTLWAGEFPADCLNILFTVLLGIMACVVSGNRRLPAFFAAVSMALGLNPNWRMSMFWQSGAANYLYITVFILAYVHCYLRELPEEEECAPRPLPGITLWIIPLGIAAGWSNENMGAAVWILSFVVIALLIRKKRKIRLWMILGNLCCLGGSILCVVAPGNYVRADIVPEEQYGTLWKLFLRCYGVSKGALQYLFAVLLVLGFLWIISRCVLRQRLEMKEFLLLDGALLSWGALILSPHYPDRAAFGTMMFCVCVSLSLAKKIVKQRNDLALPLWCVGVFIWLRGMYFCGESLATVWGWIR